MVLLMHSLGRYILLQFPQFSFFFIRRELKMNCKDEEAGAGFGGKPE